MVDTDRFPLDVHSDAESFSTTEADTRSIDELGDEIAELCTPIDVATYWLLRDIAVFDWREVRER